MEIIWKQVCFIFLCYAAIVYPICCVNAFTDSVHMGALRSC